MIFLIFWNLSYIEWTHACNFRFGAGPYCNRPANFRQTLDVIMKRIATARVSRLGSSLRKILIFKSSGGKN